MAKPKITRIKIFLTIGLLKYSIKVSIIMTINFIPKRDENFLP